MHNLPHGWLLQKLGDCVKQASTINPFDLDSTTFEYIDLGSIDNINFKIAQTKILKREKAPSRARKKVAKGFVLFATTRPNLKNIALIEDDYKNAICSTGFCAVKPNNNLQEKYLFYYLLSDHIQSQVASRIRGAQYPAISDSDLLNCTIPIPPLNEQQRIVATLEAILSKIDKAITLLQHNIDNAEKLRFASLDEVFKDFEAKGWKVLKWQDAAQKIGDIDHKMPKEVKSGIPYISAKDFLGQNRIDFVGAKMISQEDFNVLSRKIKPQRGDIIFPRYGTIGENRLVETDIDFLASYSCAIIKPNQLLTLPKYCFYYSLSPFVKKEIDTYINKATQPNIGVKSISNFTFPLPTLEEQGRIVVYLDELDTKTTQLIQHYQNKINELKRLKNSVLQSAFKGELVTEAIADNLYSSLGNAIEKKAKKQAVVIAMAMNEHEALGKSLYRTKGEKNVHVTEAQTVDDFGRQPLKMAAGPADFDYLVSVVEPMAASNGWWEVKIEEKEINGKLKLTHKYVKGANYQELITTAKTELGQNYTEAQRIASLFATLKNVRQAEVRSTAYAAWNNLLIKRKRTEVSDIVYEARENWTPEKLNIPVEEFKEAILWLIQNNLEPKGLGKEVVKYISE